MQKFARIGPIAFHLPETVEDNDLLQALFPKWDMELIYRKTGIRARHIAAPGETAADLAVVAAENLFRDHDVARDSIDFLLFARNRPTTPCPPRPACSRIGSICRPRSGPWISISAARASFTGCRWPTA